MRNTKGISKKRTVLLTGHLGHLGQYLFKSLEEEENFTLLGSDNNRHHLESAGKENNLHDKIEMIFKKSAIHSVIHLDLIHDPREDWLRRNFYNISGTNNLLQLCAKYKVSKFIFLSTANAYGPSPKNPQLISENEPLLATANSSGPDDLVKVDLLVGSFLWKLPELEIVILRPCHIIGPLKNEIGRYLQMKNPVTLMGFDPMIQLIHIDDLVSAIKHCLESKIKGIFNVKGPGEISLHRFLRALGKSPLPLPSFLAKAVLSSLWNLQLSHFPPYELHHLQYPCMVDDTLFRDSTPYVPQRGMEEIISSVRRHL